MVNRDKWMIVFSHSEIPKAKDGKSFSFLSELTKCNCECCPQSGKTLLIVMPMCWEKCDPELCVWYGNIWKNNTKASL